MIYGWLISGVGSCVLSWMERWGDGGIRKEKGDGGIRKERGKAKKEGKDRYCGFFFFFFFLRFFFGPRSHSLPRFPFLPGGFFFDVGCAARRRVRMRICCFGMG